MEVKAGYKQTEVGVIPEEWEVKFLPEVLRFRGGKAHEQHISETGHYICVNSKFISTDGNVQKYSSANFCPAKKGDVLMVMSDLPNGRALAKAYLVEEDDIYAVNQRVCALTAYRDCPEYFFYVLNRHPYFLKFDNGVSQTHLLNYVFQKCPIPVPPNVSEQRAIAEALSDVDGLLGGLERLIAKKRDIKQAAMQQLLTGKTRLPNFHGKWEVKRLGDVAEMGSGGTPSSSVPDYYDGDIPWVSISDMTKVGKVISSTDRNLTRAGFTNSAAQMFPVGTILYAMYASLGECSIADISLCSSQAILGIRPKQKLNGEYLYYFLTSLKGIVKTLGQQGTQANLNKGMVENFRISLPPLSEQTAIAEVLTEMDGELAALEQRRDKTRAIKQAMMQELLTGKTRLI